MSNFVLTKQYLREVSIFCFNWKSAAESHRMLVEVYDDTAPTDKSYREWFRCFKDEISALKTSLALNSQKNSDKELETKNYSKKIRVKRKSSLQNHWGYSTSRFCTIESHGNDSKTRKLGALWWCLLKPRDVERRFFTCEQLIQTQQRKGFLRIVTGDEKWIFYNKKKKYYAKPGQSLPSTSTSTPRSNIHNSKIMLCIWWDQKDLVYWAAEMMIPLRAIGIGYNWFVWAVHCEKNGRNTSINMIKLFFFMTMLGLMSLKS